VANRSDLPVVLFVCVHNAGRSQMAEALFRRAAGDRAVARSAGTKPAQAVHPEVAAALNEIGLDIAEATPRRLDQEVTDGVDVVVTMGCGDECPVIPGARVIDWDLPDPAGRPLREVREIRDEITRRVDGLIAELS
jgi:arsenate reductase (thioredoxin)